MFFCSTWHILHICLLTLCASCHRHENWLLCKVGNMFDTIQRNNGLTQDWSILLIQMVSSGVVDIQNNRYWVMHRLQTSLLNMQYCCIEMSVALFHCGQIRVLLYGSVYPVYQLPHPLCVHVTPLPKKLGIQTQCSDHMCFGFASVYWIVCKWCLLCAL